MTRAEMEPRPSTEWHSGGASRDIVHCTPPWSLRHSRLRLQLRLMVPMMKEMTKTTVTMEPHTCLPLTRA